jgi:hypothetical protein
MQGFIPAVPIAATSNHNNYGFVDKLFCVYIFSFWITSNPLVRREIKIAADYLL